MDRRHQNVLGSDYVPTEEEKRIFRECKEECFWYRSMPLSVVSMIATQVLLNKGFLTARSRLGFFSKVAFAGFIGFAFGKVSYIPVCMEKLKKLENSPIGELLQQKSRTHPPNSSTQKSESLDVPSWFPSKAAPTAEAPSSSAYSDDNSTVDRSFSKVQVIPFSSSMNESTPTGITDIPQEPAILTDETPKKKGVTYEELRSRNRGMYEVPLTQKADIPVKPSQEGTTKKAVKVNKYGDAWED
uniref:OCIA domain-containing protein 1 n=1 Tax=Sphenodon punctatus TaxID=8508 RepID=A0A8D0HPT3_SPHPU